MKVPFQITGIRSASSIAAIGIFLLWHLGVGLAWCASNIPVVARIPILDAVVAWLCIGSAVGAALLVPAALVFSFVARCRFPEQHFDYWGPVLALATFGAMFAEFAAHARLLVAVPW